MVSPTGNHVTIRMERVSTGGTRHAAEFKRTSSGAMSGAERMKKARVRATLFPDRQATSLRTDAERKHTSRAAHESPAPPADTDFDADTDSDAYSTSNCSEADRLEDRIMSSFRSGVEDGAAVKQLQALRAQQFAPECECSVLTEGGAPASGLHALIGMLLLRLLALVVACAFGATHAALCAVAQTAG